jgi:hypothetical protein
MMGGVSPETCWASYKYEIKPWYTVASCWIFYVNYTVMHGSTNIKLNVHIFNIRSVWLYAIDCTTYIFILFTTVYYCRMKIKSSGLLRWINVNLTDLLSPNVKDIAELILFCLKKIYLPGRIRFLFPVEARYISVLQNFQAGCGVYPTSSSVGIRVVFFGGRAAKV